VPSDTVFLIVDFLLVQSTFDMVKLTAMYKFKLHAPFKEAKEVYMTCRYNLFF